MAINYKNNPPKDDFMAEVMDLLGDDVGTSNTNNLFSKAGAKNDFDDDEEF